MTATAIPTDLDVAPLSGHIGANVRGLDLKQPLDEGSVRSIRDALLRHKILIFPGQFLEPADHVRFAGYFGEVTPAHPVIPGIDGYPEVFEIDYSQMQAMYGEARDYDATGWHTDVTFVERPPLGSILNATVMPPAGGDTMWSNQVAAYEGLGDPLREFVDTLTAIHSGEQIFGKLLEQRDEKGEWEGELFQELAPVEHPVVRNHPETGERALFVNPGFTKSIKGLSKSESDAILQLLFAHSVKPEYVVRHHWTTGDLAFWDNRATQHAVVPDFFGLHRVIQRVTLRGDEPV